ncbi:hypothetical protein SUGI_0912470 [Cryptomeria japonica]|nr:hypothetical protein SUGI_0912470 [Cryptomeria japonica]
MPTDQIKCVVLHVLGELYAVDPSRQVASFHRGKAFGVTSVSLNFCAVSAEVVRPSVTMAVMFKQPSEIDKVSNPQLLLTSKNLIAENPISLKKLGNTPRQPLFCKLVTSISHVNDGHLSPCHSLAVPSRVDGLSMEESYPVSPFSENVDANVSYTVVRRKKSLPTLLSQTHVQEMGERPTRSRPSIC